MARRRRRYGCVWSVAEMRCGVRSVEAARLRREAVQGLRDGLVIAREGCLIALKAVWRLLRGPG